MIVMKVVTKWLTRRCDGVEWRSGSGDSDGDSDAGGGGGGVNLLQC